MPVTLFPKTFPQKPGVLTLFLLRQQSNPYPCRRDICLSFLLIYVPIISGYQSLVLYIFFLKVIVARGS